MLDALGRSRDDSKEGRLDVSAFLGADEEVRDTPLGLAPELHRRLLHDLPLGVDVALVAEHDKGEVRSIGDVRVPNELLAQCIELVERRNSLHIVDENAGVTVNRGID